MQSDAPDFQSCEGHHASEEFRCSRCEQLGPRTQLVSDGARTMIANQTCQPLFVGRGVRGLAALSKRVCIGSSAGHYLIPRSKPVHNPLDMVRKFWLNG